MNLVHAAVHSLGRGIMDPPPDASIALTTKSDAVQHIHEEMSTPERVMG